jgi:hypothetical protein
LMYNFLFEGKPNYKEGYMDLKGMILWCFKFQPCRWTQFATKYFDIFIVMLMLYEWENVKIDCCRK